MRPEVIYPHAAPHEFLMRWAEGAQMGRQIIFSDIRDPRFITVRRGGALQDADHRLLAVWAADCAQHVLHFFEQAQPSDDRPRRAIEQTLAWVRGEITMTQARKAAFAANAAAREVSGAAKEAAHAAGQAVAVAHVAAHELGAAAYAIRAVRAAAPENEREDAGRLECHWQRAQLPIEIRELVLDDQRLRNEKCWSLFNIPAKGFSTHSESSSLGGEEFGSAFVFEAINSLP
jgi:immunity protein 5 of polymorphic toxin system